MSTMEILSSRLKSAFYLAGSLVFVAIGLFLPRDDDPGSWKLNVGVVFFGLCSTIFTWLLIRPQRLSLDEEGFTLSGGLVRTPKKVRWKDVDEFFVYRLPRGGKLIGYNYRPNSGEASPMTKFNRQFGADAALPKGWATPPETMANKLNTYRRQALESKESRS
ncbi:hypothetical protein [Phenylobacterium sp.]|uniref:hypothetical protein n=1 Tax=Phenylobacterium sp. TaxID=1871053 RepID=UPI0025FB4C1F|nr:hypothetical protein [Phenylobacterium sp.]